MTEFEKYAVLDRKLSTNTLQGYASSFYAPAVMEERDNRIVATDIFSRLLSDRIIFIGTAIDDDVANIVQAQILYLASVDPKADISIYLNTPGGSVSAGLAIYDTMQLVSPDIATVCAGMAASMGAVLLCAGTSGKRSALLHSRVMIHQPLGSACGQTSDILIEAREIEKCRKELYELLALHSGQPVERIFTDADRNYWMTSREAQAYGIIDTVIGRSNFAAE